MTAHRSLRLVVSALLASLACGVSARDLGYYDVNVASSKRAAAADTPSSRTNVDAIGRATFTWAQRDLDASTKASATTPEAAARAHLAALLAEAKLTGDARQSLTDVRVDAQPNGAALVRLRPRLGGVAIFREEVALLMDGKQRLVAMRGPLPRQAPDAAKSLPRFELDAKAAIAAALAAHDFAPKVAQSLVERAAAGEYVEYDAGAPAKSASGAVMTAPQRAKPVLFRTLAGLEPAWYVETYVADAPERSTDTHAFVISAVDGSVLFRKSMTAHATQGSYRVYAEAGPLGLPLPSPNGRASFPDADGLPSNDAGSPVSPELRTLANIPFSAAATDDWLPPGATTPSGNNVVAYADLVAPDGFGVGDLVPPATGPNTFDHAFRASAAPNADDRQRHASAVQLFYVANWLHDWFYDHGFREVDGNAQLDNRGRGGLGNDPMRAEAQDYDLRNNASMDIPADGRSPTMQMGVFEAVSNRDSGFDTGIVAHEWGHFLSNRLIGDGSGLDTEHAGGMGEGWSDFVALLMLIKEEDRQRSGNGAFGGAYAVGSYAEHAYYGVRRYPYSTDLAKSPLTAQFLADGVRLPASPAPRSGANGASNSSVHPQGEIWASALWDCYAGLLNDTSRLSFAEAQRRMKDYLVGGLKMTPVSPTMTEARDAILATMIARGANEDLAICSAAFAKRGLGAGAHIPDRYSNTMRGVVESRTTGAAVSVGQTSVRVPEGCDADTVFDAGETAAATVEIRNTGFTTLGGATVTVSASTGAVTFPQGNTITVGAIPRFESRNVSVPVALGSGLATNALVTLTAAVTSPGATTSGPPVTVTSNVNFDYRPRSGTIETFDGDYTDWQNALTTGEEGSGSTPWTVEPLVFGARLLRGPDTNSNSVAWIQTPVMSVGAGPLQVTLMHRFAFETGPEDFYDGGVIQASVDGGATWTDVDPQRYGAAFTLSDCCGNPLAGRRALTDTNFGYPGFEERVIDLGTTYANRANFRLRFGVATDENTTRNGWDIGSVSITGLADTPFSTLLPQPANCAATSFKRLQGAMSGTYYSASRSGEGVLVDFGRVGNTPIVFFSWYTYLNGRQQWLVGSAPFDASDTTAVVDLVSTRGTGFGSRFRAEDVDRLPWGSASLSFPDCNAMVLSYRGPGGESGTQTLSRGFERAAPAECPASGGLAGTYAAEGRSGEGVLVDFGRLNGQAFEFLAWYTYEDGAQRWLVGSQPYAPAERSTVELFQTTGARFGNAFDTRDVTTTPWGRVTQRFTNCDTLELAYEKTGGETGTIVLKRGLERVDDGQCR